MSAICAQRPSYISHWTVQNVKPRRRITIVDSSFLLPLPNLATCRINHWSAKALGHGAVIGQAAARRTLVPVRDGDLRILIILTEVDQASGI
jgi:hypothetical protein